MTNPEYLTTEADKVLTFTNSDGEPEVWFRFIDLEGEIKWYSPLRELWAGPNAIDKLNRRLEVVIKGEKNMALIMQQHTKQLRKAKL